MLNQPPNQEEFRRYLDDTGLNKVITRILIQLFEESPWPEDPIGYFKHYLECPLVVNVDALRAENEELQMKNEELETTLDSLMDQLEKVRDARNNSN